MKRLVYVGTAVLAVAFFGCQRRSESRSTAGSEEGASQESSTGAYGGGTAAGQQQPGQAEHGMSGQQGAAEQGAAQQGAAEQGAAQQGAAEQGAAQQGAAGQQGQRQPGETASETASPTGAYGAGSATGASAGGSCAQVSSCFSKISDQLCKGDSQCQSTFSTRNVPQSESACQAELSRVKDMVQPYARKQSNFMLPSECQAKGNSQGQQGSQGGASQGGSMEHQGTHDTGTQQH